MKKIILFYPGYIPGKRYGGPVTSMYHFSEMFGDVYDIRIVCLNHDFLDKEIYQGIEKGWNSIGKSKVMYLNDNEFNSAMFDQIIGEIEPDLIYSSSIFSFGMNYPLIKISRKRGIPLLLAPRGELSSDRLKNKSWKKRPFIYLLKVTKFLDKIAFQATSDAEYEDIINVLAIKPNNVYLVPNIPCSIGTKRNNTKEKGKIRIVATSRLQKKNNQLYSIKLVKRLKGEVIFDIYGPQEDPEYWAECEKEILTAPKNVSFNYRGVLPLTEIEKVYLDYDCLLHPTFSENYGHVIVEALCHECPIIISKGTTPWDSVEEKNAGFICELGEDQEFITALEKITNMDQETYSQMIMGTREYVKRLNLDDIKMQYINMFQSIILSN